MRNDRLFADAGQQPEIVGEPKPWYTSPGTVLLAILFVLNILILLVYPDFNYTGPG